jgi:predicted RNase H-like nuclease (RuvC/YqgF family)
MFQQAESFESLYTDELNMRKMLEEELKKQKEELVSMISQRDSLNEELQRALDHNKWLERQLAEYGDRIHWLEKKIQTQEDLQRDSRIRLDVKLKKARDLKKKQGEDSSFDVAKLCSEFSFAEIKEATDNFNPSLKIGEGGYGIVYKGFLRHNEVAIKVWDSNSRQGSMEFRHEVFRLERIFSSFLVLLLLVGF